MPDAAPHLTAAGATWDDGPAAGLWIADRLAPFGASVGHAAPLGYPAYAVAPLWPEDDTPAERGCLPVLEALIAGTTEVVDALVADPRLNAAHATPDHELDTDD